MTKKSPLFCFLLFLTGLGGGCGLYAQEQSVLSDVSTLYAVESDKYAGLAVDREGRKWLAAVSTLDKKDRIIVRHHKNTEWSEPVILSTGEGVESAPSLIADSPTPMATVIS